MLEVMKIKVIVVKTLCQVKKAFPSIECSNFFPISSWMCNLLAFIYVTHPAKIWGWLDFCVCCLFESYDFSIF